MPLVLHISDSCVQVVFLFFYRVVACLVTVTVLHIHSCVLSLIIISL